ncbi:beta-lactamase family protein [Leptospira inadai serovar Lyme str. 10]|uniref:Beta-lactamase family protein n=2 Tax=Leptospira inadai serovar Lyme TaxID=293084 RepID=V6HC16_9LEPT|nr:MBL fold metallo-hydrolase [Leptospira inadai]EQA37082.1 beta-lactamase family protein [Leptospira inadai serovar Lyme str. 10]PNV76585.1 MBL fold metallo-hydrolase [Leptospira inadai serovar Lyme]
MRIKFWGVRGSISSPVKGDLIRAKILKILSLASPSDLQSPEAIEDFLDSLALSNWSTYGGNTTCIEIRDKEDRLIIIDGGTGLRELGNSILQEGYLQGKGSAVWIFTHTHWDHIQGIPFFVPLYTPGNKFEFVSSVENLEERLRYQHAFTHFPVPFDGFQAGKTYRHVPEGRAFRATDSVTAISKAVRHPGGSYSYRFEEDGKSLIFASDAEFNLDEMENIDDYLNYFRGADVLVFDTQYTFEESLQKIDWGHSTASMATDIALRANVKKLVMFHHDPSYDDEKLDAVYLRAIKYKEMFDPDNQLEIIMAREGLEIQV